MSVGRGKVVEAVKVTSLQLAERLTSATVYYNGGPVTTATSVMIDTQDYDEIVFMLSVGTVLGDAVTLSNAVYESDTDDPNASTLLTGASFTDRNSANDETTEVASVLCKNTKRYVALRTEVAGSLPTIDFAAGCLLGKSKSQAISNSPIFDLAGY